MSPTIKLFLCGDVMTGRGIDQILPFPSDPTLHEPYMTSAAGYVKLAESANGPIPRPVAPAYIWGDALEVIRQADADLRIVNLETSVTTSSQWVNKGVNYRMHPKNIDCLTAARIDCCELANNHVLDWGEQGLLETLAVLHRAGIQTAGAGQNLKEALAPAALTIAGKGRVLVFSVGDASSGIPSEWAAAPNKPGVAFLDRLSPLQVGDLAARVAAVKGIHDVAMVSIHWGGNWGYEIPHSQRRFARALIDEAQVDIVHGHSSHHVKGFEIYKGKLILYGCGDFLTDYEGIGGYEQYRGDLGVMYFAGVDRATGELESLDMVPVQMRRFRLGRASAADVEWLKDVLNREGKPFGTGVELKGDDRLTLKRAHGGAMLPR